MANYVSALNGEQMDAALIDVALHNSEAWAVGTRNTIPVSSSDETYHNNAKYYAQVAQSAIPGTYTAAVRWDIAQGLAGEAQEQARANISAGASNRNLLDNPWFTVNQREFTSSTGSNGVKTVDRWEINNGGGTGGIVSVTSEGYISIVTGSAYISYQEKFGKDELAGRTVTMSINDDGNIYSYSFTVPARTASTQTGGSFVFKTGCRCNFFVMPTTSAYGYNFQLSIGQGYSATIRAVKLELGSYSTLANDVPQNDELECLKYQELIQNVAYNYVPIGFGAFAGGNTIRMFIPTSVPMNAASLHASVPITGSASVAGNGTTISVASITLVGVLRTGVYVNVNLNSAPTTGHTYSLMLGDGASILIDCNL